MSHRYVIRAILGLESDAWDQVAKDAHARVLVKVQDRVWNPVKRNASLRLVNQIYDEMYSRKKGR